MAEPYAPKIPIQARFHAEEVATLDVFIAQQPFPPSRPDVLRRALLEWLAQQDAARSAPAPDPAMEGGAIPEPQENNAVTRERERKRRNAAAYRQRQREKGA